MGTEGTLKPAAKEVYSQGYCLRPIEIYSSFRNAIIHEYFGVDTNQDTLVAQ